ncbi:TAXI family TRAP transporter solute-binding subunit [Chloroflexota bacterium]
MKRESYHGLAVCLAVILAIGLLIAACAPKPAPAPAPSPAPAPAPAPAPKPAPAPVPKPAPPKYEWPRTLPVATTGMGGTTNVIPLAIFSVMEPKTGMKIRVIPEDSPATRQAWLKAGIVDLASDPVSHSSDAIEGILGFATRQGGPYHLRIVWHTVALPVSYIVRGDSEIKTIYDIKPGHRIAYLISQPSSIRLMDGLLAWIGLNKEDVTVVEFGSFSANVRSVMEGKADVAFTSHTSSLAQEVAAGPHGVRVLELPAKEDPEGAKRARSFYRRTVYAPAKIGIKEGLGVTVWILMSYLETRADTDPEFVYHFAKWLGENLDAYKDKHTLCQYMGIDEFVGYLDNAFLPVHEGTIRYLKEKGKWTDALKTRNEQNITLVSRYVEAYEKAIGMADDKGIKVDPSNEAWMELWENYKKELGLPGIG